MRSMKACVLVADGRLEYRDVPLAEIPGWYKIKIAFAGICGSDLARGFRKGAYHYPLIMGHEFSGIVEKTPPGGRFAPGSRVAVYPLLPCFGCDACRSGYYQHCRDYDYFGSRRDGGFAEYVFVPEFNLVAVPDGVTLEEAALCEPAAVARRAVFSHSVAPGGRALVIGGGPVGLLAAEWLRIRGMADVAVVDVRPAKLALAAELGFSVCSPGEAERKAGSFDICVEACGVNAARNLAFACCAARGHIFLIGNPADDIVISPSTYSAILRRELSFCGSWNSLPTPDWSEVMSHAGKTLELDKLITGVFPLSQTPEVLTRIASGNGDGCKTLLNCQE